MPARRWGPVLTLSLLAALWTAPPHAVIDDASGGTRHTALGHHPRWSPPTRAEASRALRESEGSLDSVATEELRIIRNNVRLGLETILILAAGGAVTVIAGRTERHKD